ncbi:MAG: PadR family transcriptional regulator [Defluviitaleaceae bacterium]|nr:PadR family transcriptional regulator [Defluviitaleaceae bacterium]
MEAQIKKGILEMCVLHLISQKEIYGYDVMRRLRTNFPEVNESTFYSILRRLHNDGNAEVFLREGAGGPARKYYAITDAGRRELAHSINIWMHIRGEVDKILST